MINYHTSHNHLARSLNRALLAIVLFMLALSFAKAQPCPATPKAGGESISLSDGGTVHAYPSALPTGVTDANPDATHGSLIHDGSKGTITPLTTATIHPQWTDGTMGWAIINFYYLDIASSGAIIKVYNGVNTSTAPVFTITSANASTYYRYNYKYNGPITVTMENTTSTGTGNFDVGVAYMTGEVVATSAFGQEITFWKHFITPNSRAYVDSRAGNAATIATGYFDANRNLVSSELSWCIDYGQDAPRRGNEYPGQIVFYPTARPDINEDGTVTTQDKLKTARLIYILQHVPQPITDPANFDAVRAAVDGITTGSYSGGLAGDAIAAIPSLPSPEEPTFSITGPATPAAAGTPQNFVVNLTNDGGHPRVYKLKVPAGVTVNSVTGSGVTYNAANQNITFASAPASASVSVTSPTIQTATLGVAYEQPGFWNVSNLIIYEPCDTYNVPGNDYQGFLGLSKSENPYPFREASGTWTAAPCYNDEKITNGGFAGNANGWNISGGGWTYSSGEMVNQNNAAVNQILWQSMPPLTTQPYKLTFKLGSTDQDNATTTQTASLAIKIGGVTYATFNNAAGTSNNVTLTLANGATSDFVPYSSTNARIDHDVTIYIPHDVSLASPGVENQIHFVFNANGDDFYLDNISLLGCAGPSAFLCNDSDILYSGSPSGSTTLYDLNYSANPLVRTPIGSSAASAYNAIGFNTVDGFVYGILNELGPNSNHLIRIDAAGTMVDLGAVTGLPTQATTEYNAGDFDAAGFLYVMTNSSTSIYKINVINKTATTIALSPASPVAVSDIAYHGGLFYGVRNSNSQLVSISPSGVVTAIGTTYTTGVFGAMMGACNGIFGIANNGGFYKFDIATGTRTKLADTPAALSGVDGAHCQTACIDTGPLPVKLVGFNATKEGSGVNLSWSTTEEINSSYFGVEHSMDAKNWATLGTVKSNVESVTKRNYNYTHATPSEGINYYRLKMVDLDETFAYSRVMSVTTDTPLATLAAYPNPVSGGRLIIAIAGTESYHAAVHNLRGVQVLQQNLGKERELNVSGLVPGAYVLSIRSASGAVRTSTFVVK